MVPPFAALTTQLVPAKGHVPGQFGTRAVDAHVAALKGLGHAQGPVQVPRVDGRVEAVLGGIGQPDGLVLRLERVDADDGPKDLLLHDRGLLGRVEEDGGLDKVPLARVELTVPAQRQLGARRLALVNVREHVPVLDVVRLRAVVGLWAGRVAHARRRGEPLAKGRGEAGGGAPLHVDAAVGHADLARVVLDGKGRVGDGLVEVGVGKDDGGRLAAQLENDLFQVGLGGRLLDLAAGGGGAGKGDDAHVEVGGQDGARGVAVARQDVEDAGGEAGGLDELGALGQGEGGLLARLEDDRVAGHEGGAALDAKEVEGEIPRDDDGHDAVGLAKGHVDVARRVEAAGALHLAPALGVVLQLVHGRVGVKKVRHGLAHGLRVEHGELLVVLAEERRQLLEILAALGGRGRRPGWEGRLGCCDGCVGVVLAGLGNYIWWNRGIRYVYMSIHT